MLPGPLADWLDDLLAHDVCIDESPLVEATNNHWGFRLSHYLALDTSPESLMAFVHAVAAVWHSKVLALAGGPMWIYCWVDEQIPSLDVSMVSTRAGSLPFDRKTLARPLRSIVTQYLDDPIPDDALEVIRSSDLGDNIVDNVDTPLPVWFTVIGVD